MKRKSAVGARVRQLRGGLALLALAPLLPALPAAAHDASTVTASPRQTYNLNPGWRMTTGDQAGAQQPGFDDKGWQGVTLPNAFNETQAFARDIKALSTGIIWYRKHITLPADAARGKAFLEFEGVRQAAEIWVNGRSVALSEHGVMAFGADITAALKPGDNVIAVRVDNDWKYKERATGSGFQWNNDNFNVNYGGITKNVRLHLTGQVYQTLPLYSTLGSTGQYIWADGFDIAGRRANIHAESQVRNDSAAAGSYSVSVTQLASNQTVVANSALADPSELVGSGVLFAALAAVMALTRRVDWHMLGRT